MYLIIIQKKKTRNIDIKINYLLVIGYKNTVKTVTNVL